MAKKKKAIKSKPARAAAKPKSMEVAAKPSKPAKATKTRAKSRRLSWLDAKAQIPVIDRYARQLGTFIDAMADGIVDTVEVKAQEKRLVALMKQIEPKLNDELHQQVTELLCELTAYDLMQTLCAMHDRRPKTAFRG